MPIKPKMHMFGQLIFATVFFSLIPSLAQGAAAAASNGAQPHAVCKDCHIAGSPQVATAMKPIATSQTRPCIECHSDVLHAPGGGQTSSTYFSGHMIDNGLEKKIAPLGGKSLNRLDCLSCHTPHFQGQPKLLRLNTEAEQASHNSGATYDPATLLCLSCHPVAAETKTTGRGYVRHPIGVPVRRAGTTPESSQFPPLVDVKGTGNPSDYVIGCTTCHYPHASKNGFLLRWSMAELSNACLQCHPEVAPPSGSETSKGLIVSR